MSAFRALGVVSLDLGGLLDHERMIADRAWSFDGLIPTGEITLGIIAAPIEQLTTFGGLLHDLTATSRLWTCDSQSQSLGGFAVRVT